MSWGIPSGEESSIPSSSSRQSSTNSVEDSSSARPSEESSNVDEHEVGNLPSSSSTSFHVASPTPSENNVSESSRGFRIPLSKSVPNLRGILNHKNSNKK